MRSFFRWLLFTLCLLVFTGVMGWISVRMLDLEQDRQETLKEAQEQEKIRLALWRMDSQASTLLIRENSRPPYQYQAFYAPDDLFASKTESIPKGAALIPSPLFASLPDMVNLHFELMLDDSSLSSPQSPSGPQKELATSWYSLGNETEQTNKKLIKLKDLLARHPEVRHLPFTEQVRHLEIKPPEVGAKLQAQQVADPKVLGKDFQNISNSKEMSQRALILDNNIAQEKKEYAKPQISRKISPPPVSKAAVADEADAGSRAESSPSPSSSSNRLRGLFKRGEGTVEVTETPAPQRQSLPALAGDLQPVWVENELFLIRHVTMEGRARLQGVWIDWALLESRLSQSIRDLLPEATLKSVPVAVARTDVNALVTLPVALVPGTVPITLPINGSALRPALAVAWGCLIAAALAIAFVLHRAVLLSERRGAFVSAVTHELRTPLTTFRLYSEMLADDMVPEGPQRRSYLQTLCDESTRLMHLVENVLAYSRIERGRTAGRMETVNLESLIHRIVPRLQQRADQADLEVQVKSQDNAMFADVEVDTLAVEQILFNLTDNACKYAAPDCDPRELHLTIEQQGDWVSLSFRDFGPGLPKSQKKRLFQPFSKSATEAAHSAPGVGLGLALSRRLAREIGGDLIYRVPQGRGVAFELRLRVSTGK